MLIFKPVNLDQLPLHLFHPLLLSPVPKPPIASAEARLPRRSGGCNPGNWGHLCGNQATPRMSRACARFPRARKTPMTSCVRHHGRAKLSSMVTEHRPHIDAPSSGVTMECTARGFKGESYWNFQGLLSVLGRRGK